MSTGLCTDDCWGTCRHLTVAQVEDAMSCGHRTKEAVAADLGRPWRTIYTALRRAERHDLVDRLKGRIQG